MTEIVQFPKPIDNQRGLMNSYPCGCQVRTDGAGCYTIHACPTHRAAPALREALRIFANLDIAHMENRPDETPVFGLNDSLFTVGDVRQARLALKTAEEAE